jgi:hypothetical protein
MALSPAERLLQELGVTEPEEIDLDAIAYYVNARVRYRPLDGCEARIIGNGDAAIITVNGRSAPRRKRFSLAHEIGHWQHHRGKRLVCSVEDYRPDNPLSPERVADGFAADLLMPNYLFRPLSRRHDKLTFKTVNALADLFMTSAAATVIRLVESDHSPAMVVCHGSGGRKWFRRAPCVPSRWFPQEQLDSDSFAFDVLFGNRSDDPMPRKVGADAWFDRRDAERYEVQEQTIRTRSDEILTLLLFSDPAMLEEW